MTSETFIGPRLGRAVSMALALILACVAALPVAAARGDKPVLFRAGAYDPASSGPPVPEALRARPLEDGGTRLFIFQLEGPVDDRTREAVARRGGRLLDYIPDDTFVLRLPASEAGAVAALSGVRFLGPLHPGLKIAPDLGRRSFSDPARRDGSGLTVVVELFAHGPAVEVIAAAVAATGATVLRVEPPPLRRLRVRATREQVEAVAALDEVAFIEEMGEITRRNDTTRWVIQSNSLGLSSVWDHGLHGEGQVVGVVDDPLDMSSCYFLDPEDNTVGPDHRKVVAYRSSTGQGAVTHGTHVAGTVAGDQGPVTGGNYGAGMAYAARIAFENVDDIGGSGSAPSNLYEALENAFLDGARVHTNSWGDDGATSYTSWCVDVDRFSHDYEASLVLFAETNQPTLRSPENAKNLVAVGASRNGPNAGEHCRGGIGPTPDGRLKPDLFAPGCSILSATPTSDCSTTSLTGTSMASPAVAGAAMLARQYFLDGFYPSGTPEPADTLVPSGALLKAVLLNGTVNMDSYGGGPPPNDREGWGRLLLEDALYFDGDDRRLAVLADPRNADGLSTGQTREFVVGVNEGVEPLRITMVFTDPPGSLLAGDPVVNDLDLEVESPDGTVYLGNAIESGQSVPGGSADPRNNVEQVMVEDPQAGGYTVRVRGTAVNQGLQGFALVATGDVTATTGPFLTHLSHVIDDAPPLGNGDGLLDPGETVALSVVLRNSGSEDALQVSAEMGSDRKDSVKITRRDASFPDVPRGQTGESEAPHLGFTVQPDATCGDEVRFLLDTSAVGFEGDTSFVVGIGEDTESYPGGSLPLGKRGTWSSTLDATRTFVVAEARVTVDISHEDVGQLRVVLTSPQGTSVTLHDQTAAGTSDIRGTYGDDLTPDGPGSLADFAGEPAEGPWTLTIVDTIGGKVRPGQLNGWSLLLRATVAFKCDTLACGDPTPGSVGPTVMVEESGSDLMLHWQPASDALAYRLWRSPLPDMAGEILRGETIATGLTEAGEHELPGSWFYTVRAVNGCGWEGP